MGSENILTVAHRIYVAKEYAHAFEKVLGPRGASGSNAWLHFRPGTGLLWGNCIQNKFRWSESGR